LWKKRFFERKRLYSLNGVRRETLKKEVEKGFKEGAREGGKVAGNAATPDAYDLESCWGAEHVPNFRQKRTGGKPGPPLTDRESADGKWVRAPGGCFKFPEGGTRNGRGLNWHSIR